MLAGNGALRLRDVPIQPKSAIEPPQPTGRSLLYAGSISHLRSVQGKLDLRVLVAGVDTAYPGLDLQDRFDRELARGASPRDPVRTSAIDQCADIPGADAHHSGFPSNTDPQAGGPGPGLLRSRAGCRLELYLAFLCTLRKKLHRFTAHSKQAVRPDLFVAPVLRAVGFESVLPSRASKASGIPPGGGPGGAWAPALMHHQLLCYMEVEPGRVRPRAQTADCAAGHQRSWLLHDHSDVSFPLGVHRATEIPSGRKPMAGGGDGRRLRAGRSRRIEPGSWRQETIARGGLAGFCRTVEPGRQLPHKHSRDDRSAVSEREPLPTGDGRILSSKVVESRIRPSARRRRLRLERDRLCAGSGY